MYICCNVDDNLVELNIRGGEESTYNEIFLDDMKCRKRLIN